MLVSIKKYGWLLALTGPLCLMLAVVCQGDDPATGAAVEDPYAIPAGATEEQLQQQFQILLSSPPPTQTPDGVKNHLQGIRRFAQGLQDPERQVSEELLDGAFQIELQILQLLSEQLGDPDAAAELEGFMDRLEQDERPVAQQMLAVLRTEEKIEGLADLSAEDRAAFIEEIAMALGGEMDDNALGFAQMLGSQMEDVAPAEAAAVYELFVKYVSASADPRSAQIAEYFQGKANYVGLIGNEMEFTSTTLDGQPFDLETFRGENKVVLVDFWATWCGPCIGELPNLKAHYEAYHGQGFEVVGVSLDDDPAALQQFLTDQQIAWPTVIDADPVNQGWDNPIARQYGISAIPACILINQEGKVVSLNARGAELGRLLEELLGPPPAPVGQ